MCGLFRVMEVNTLIAIFFVRSGTVKIRIGKCAATRQDPTTAAWTVPSVHTAPIKDKPLNCSLFSGP